MHAYATSQTRTDGHVTIAVFAVILAVLLNWVVETIGAPPSWLIGAPALAGTYGILFKVFNRWAWRWSIGGFRVVDTPDIEGTYVGELTSSYEGGTSLPVRIEIDQTWTAIAVRFEVTGTSTSSSRSVTAGLDQAGHERACLTYTYRNQTSPGVAPEDLNDHDGTAELHIDGDGNVRGRYYNLRGRNGSLRLTKS